MQTPVVRRVHTSVVPPRLPGPHHWGRMGCVQRSTRHTIVTVKVKLGFRNAGRLEKIMLNIYPVFDLEAPMMEMAPNMVLLTIQKPLPCTNVHSGSSVKGSWEVDWIPIIQLANLNHQ
jgi:hypothetical protein